MEKIFFSKNIKFLRERERQTQENLANILAMGRSKLNSLEMGRSKAYQPEDLVKFSRHFKISIDALLGVDLSTLGELKLRQLEAGNDVYIKGGNLRVLAITVNRDNEENVELVPIKAKAGYRAGYNDPEYIGQLPKYSIPDLPKGRSYRIFPTTGDSMLPIPENSQVIGAFVQDLGSIKSGTLCIVVLNGQGEDFVFKSVENRIATDRCLVLHSLNELYPPYSVPIEDVLEVWEMKSYMSDTVPGGNITMSLIAGALKDIQVTVNQIAARK